MRADVIVVGLGSMGSAAAYRLALRGVRVLGLDRFAPPHDRGAHAGGSRIIRTAYMEGAEYVPLVRRSYELWRELESAAGETLLAPTGGLMLGHPDSIAVAGAVATARAEGLAHELLDADAVRRRFGVLTPADDEVALHEEAAGVLRPEAAIAAFLRLAAAAGALVRTGTTVTAWTADHTGVSVTTDDGEAHRADRLILAPGAWATALVAGPADVENAAAPSPAVRVERRVQHYWHPAGGLDGFEPGRLPIWIWSTDNGGGGGGGGPTPAEGDGAPGGPADGAVAYGVPAADGIVKAALHTGSEPADPDRGVEAVRDDDLSAMRAWLAPRIPRLAEGRWAGAKPCLYALTPDGHFVLGPHPRHEHVAIAYGFSGHGFKFAPVVGEVLADLTTSGTTAHNITLFDPTARRSWL